MELGVWHLITSEYPPQIGGVSDYTQLVANGLAAAGDEVHVWCPPASGKETVPSQTAGEVMVHREMGGFAPADLKRASKLLDEFRAPRRLLVQWVPHGYGYQSMNLAFCVWLWKRAKLKNDRVEIMVHEPSLGLVEGSWKQTVVASVNRMMILVLLSAASRIWISIPQWEQRFRPLGFGRNKTFAWLPVPSNIPVVEDPAGVAAIRSRFTSDGQLLLGHFGAYDHYMTELMLRLVPSLLNQREGIGILLLGKGSRELRDILVVHNPGLADRLHATGVLDNEQLSKHLSACDVMLQPYKDGVSGRRGSVMAALAHGRCVVTTKGVATEDCWVESEAVKIALSDSNADLVETLNTVLGDAGARHCIGVAARVLYEARFDVKRTVAALRQSARATADYADAV